MNIAFSDLLYNKHFIKQTIAHSHLMWSYICSMLYVAIRYLVINSIYK